jgi:hypothetical protein
MQKNHVESDFIVFLVHKSTFMTNIVNDKSPKYHIDIEGHQFDWNEDLIITEQIISLGGWEPSQGAVIIDLKDNSEATLQPGQQIELKPGIGFSKKVKFKRGSHD